MPAREQAAICSAYCLIPLLLHIVRRCQQYAMQLHGWRLHTWAPYTFGVPGALLFLLPLAWEPSAAAGIGCCLWPRPGAPCVEPALLARSLLARAPQVGGERKLLAMWVFMGCEEIWQLEDDEVTSMQEDAVHAEHEEGMLHEDAPPADDEAGAPAPMMEA